MNRTLISYSLQEVKRILRKEAEEICRKLSPMAVEVEIIEPLRNIRVFVKCIDLDDDRIDKLVKMQ